MRRMGGPSEKFEEISKHPSMYRCAGGTKVLISPFRPYFGLCRHHKPQGTVPTALAVSRGLLGVGPAQGPALVRL